MDNGRLLTQTSDGRWRKVIDGRTYYFGKVDPEAVEESYREAERRYQEFMAKRKRRSDSGSADRRTVGSFASKYSEHMFARYERGEISAGHCDRAKHNIEWFARFAGRSTPLQELTELRLEEYRDRILRRPRSRSSGRRIGSWSAKSRLDTVKASIRWGYRVGLIDRLPRNIDGYSCVSQPPPKVKVFTPEEVAMLLALASERMQCWVLLALNCGYGASDLAALRRSEVDLDNAVIIRRRTKTGVECRHVLWPETLGACRQAMLRPAAPTARVFRSAHGRPLVHEEIVEGKLRKTDAVRSNFNRLKRAGGITDSRGFYCLRKTGATAIERIDPTVTGMFLAHTRRDMIKHYAAPAWVRLDAAIREARVHILGATDAQLSEGAGPKAVAEEAERRRRLLSLAGGWAEQSRIEALLGEVRRRLDGQHLSAEDRDALLAWMVWAEGVAASLSPFNGGLEGLPSLTHAEAS